MISSFIIQKKNCQFCRNLLNRSSKKSQVRFALKIYLSNYFICQFAQKDPLDAKDGYIQAMLMRSEKLAAKMNFLEFQDKNLLETIKAEKKKENSNKNLNFLDDR